MVVSAESNGVVGKLVDSVVAVNSGFALVIIGLLVLSGLCVVCVW